MAIKWQKYGKNGFSKHPEHINREGPPKKEWTWGGLFKDLMEENGNNTKKVKIAMAKAMMKKAQKGDVQAFKEIANRMDGMPTQNVNSTVKLSMEDLFLENIKRKNGDIKQIKDNN